MTQTINNKIRRGFSAAAKRYDLYSSLHREIADKLLAQVAKERAPSALLDVGCGTGYLTSRLKEQFPQSKIIGLDFSPEMLKMAADKHDGIDWVLADGNNLPFSDGSIDILTSNLAYQWAEGLSGNFTQARRVLSPNGVLACTLFGYHTCQELFNSLLEAKKEDLIFTRLPSQEQVREALISSGFNESMVEEEQIKIYFKDMHELIAWLKIIGANNLPREGYVGKEAFGRAASIYRERFSYNNGIQATFEVIKVYAKK